MKCFIGLLFLVFSVSVWADQQFSIEQLTIENGLANNSVRTIFQDQDGFLWFGTLNGLSRYDGKHFKTFAYDQSNSLSISNNKIREIFQDGLGYIWVTTYDNSVHRFDTKTETFINFPDDLGTPYADDLVHLIYESDPGVIWIYLADNGCVRIISNKNNASYKSTWYTSSDGLRSNSVNKIWKDSKDGLWISTTAGTAHLTKEQSLADIPKIESYYFSNPTLSAVAFCENDEAIWIGTQSGKIFTFKNDRPTLFWEIPQNKVNLSGIRQMEALKNGDIIVATEMGVLCIENKTQQLHHYTTKNSNLNSDYVMSFYVDQYSDCWLVTNQRGVTRFEVEAKKFTHYKLHPEIRQSIVEGEKQVFQEDINGNLWLGIYGGGISRFNRESNQFEQFLHEENNPSSLSSNLILSLAHDKSGNLLAGTYKRGVNKINLTSNNFNTLKTPNYKAGDFLNEMRAVFEDSRKWIWTGNKRGEVIIYNQQFEKLFSLNELLGAKSISTGVYAFEEDDKQNIWIGTKGNGIIVLTNLSDDSRQNLQSKVKLIEFKRSSASAYKILRNDVFDLHFDSAGQMWVANYHGGVNVIKNPLKPDQEILAFSHVNNEKSTLSDNRVRCFCEDFRGNMWIGTSYGLNFVSSVQLTSNKKRFYTIERTTSPNSLSYNDIISITEDSEQNLWVATLGGGVNKLNWNDDLKFTFDKIQKKQGLTSDLILSVVEDNNKRLWISTDFGLNKFNLINGVIEKYYNDDGLPENSFSEGKGICTSNGKLIFGHILGSMWFTPDSVKKSQQVAPMILTDLKVNGIQQKELLVKASKLLNDSSSTLNLKYNENFLTFEFVALDFKAPLKIQYQFKLEGFEANWNRTGNMNTAIYRELSPGDYTFRFKASNSDGIWVNPEMKLRINIASPPWRTNLAYSIYLIVILSLIFILQRFILERLKLKHEVAYEKQLADDKLKFYTSISHEFKTPLALIMGPIEDLLSRKKIDTSMMVQLKMVKRNTRRLQELIDQLMDFRKIQKGFFKAEINPGDLVIFLNDIYLAFQPLAKRKSVNFEFLSDKQQLTVSTDYKSLEKIVFNLLSNAFKHTGPNKSIVLKLIIEASTNQFIIVISDEGDGIRKEDLPLIFKRFNRGNRSKWSDDQGSGIGLSFCSELVEILGGKIKVESEYGKGSSFSVILPLERAISTEQLKADSNTLDYTNKYLDTIDDKKEQLASNNSSTKQDKILIVEDNQDMQIFLANHLSLKYSIIQAYNGQQGIELAKKENPDLIICDIMMPKVSGLELTSTIKNEFHTSHIPIILLTARSLEEQKIEGIETGADDYIVKPFNMVYLEKRINNILKQRKQLFERFKHDPEIKPETLSNSKEDQAFIDKITKLVEDNIADPDFSVDTLLPHFSFGRTVFYKKMKGISGYPPKDFIRIIRMKKAGDMMKNPEAAVAQVAFDLGYNDPDYFSRIFKKHFGQTPSEYKKKI